jgi:hypothetical protein
MIEMMVEKLLGTRKNLNRAALVLATTVVTMTGNAHAFFLDGNGHYALRGVTEKNPGFSTASGTYQVIEQSFRLEGEARMNDKSSFFLDMRLTDDPGTFFLGDRPKPRACSPRRVPSGDNTYTTTTDCTDRHQDTGSPGYKPYQPIFTSAYARQAFDLCLVEAGRRPRNWGIGVMMDGGSKPFSSDWSVYDGIDCHVNIQKSQSIGFKVGYDKLAETGTWIDNPYDRNLADPSSETEFDGRGGSFGATNPSDDLDQYFFTIEYDDRKANAGAAFTKQIGIYFANVIGKDSKTDIKLVDLYTALYLSNLTLKNELLFRLGKSADPSWIELGGARFDNGDVATNNVQSVGFAGVLEWTMSRDGSAIGPADYRQGNASRQLMFLDFAYAPGDENAYFRDSSGLSDESLNTIGESQRSSKTGTMGFHRNYQPALILFSGKSGTEKTGVPGVYDPGRLMNVTMLGLGYRLESMESGVFEAKLLNARMNAAIPQAVRSYYESAEGDKPVGFHGDDFGFELDLKYGVTPSREFEYGVEAGYARPGNALKVSNAAPAPVVLLQSYAAFKF